MKYLDSSDVRARAQLNRHANPSHRLLHCYMEHVMGSVHHCAIAGGAMSYRRKQKWLALTLQKWQMAHNVMVVLYFYACVLMCTLCVILHD
jgi:CBS domain containing-hemolysin-like protein